MSGRRSRRGGRKIGEDVEAVEEILAEFPLRHRGLEVAVRRGHEADVDRDRMCAAEPLELPLLQDAQELHLRRGGQVSHLVQEERPLVGELEAPLLLGPRVREGAGLVAEELGLDQALGQRGAAHPHERLARARRVVVDRVRDELLAGSRLSADENRRVSRGGLRDLLVELLHRPAVADDVLQVVAALQLALELEVLVEKALALPFDQPIHVHRLPEERGHDLQERCGAGEVARRVVRQREPEGADGAAFEREGDGHEAQLVPRRGRDGENLVRRFEKRLARHLRNDDRLPARHDAARDALARAQLRRRPPPGGKAGGSFELQLACRLVDERGGDDASPVALAQDGERAVQRRAETPRRPQHLRELQEGRELPQIPVRAVAVARHSRDPTGMSELMLLGDRNVET